MAATPDDRGYWLVSVRRAGLSLRRRPPLRLGESARPHRPTTSSPWRPRPTAGATGSSLRRRRVPLRRRPALRLGDPRPPRPHGRHRHDPGRARVLARRRPAAACSAIGNARFYGSAPIRSRQEPDRRGRCHSGRPGLLAPADESRPCSALPPPGEGFLAGHVTSIGDSVMLDAQPEPRGGHPRDRRRGAGQPAMGRRRRTRSAAQVGGPARGDRHHRPRDERTGDAGAVHHDDGRPRRRLAGRVRHHPPSPVVLLVAVGERHPQAGRPQVLAGPARRLQQARRREPAVVRSRRHPHADRWRRALQAMAKLIKSKI